MSSSPNGLSRGVSVVVCCYNSSDRIEMTLQHLAAQQLPDDLLVELLVVDNNSTDGTSAMVAELWNEMGNPFSMRILQEEKAGLSHARKCGIDQAKFKYVLFCDDDNWLNPNYLFRGYKTMEANPQLGMLGGEGRAQSEVELPDWFEQYQIMYAVGPQFDRSPDITNTKSYVYGAGSFVRTSLVRGLLESDIVLVTSDRKGNKLVSGGDNELGYLIRAAGYKIYWDPKLEFKHQIPVDRLNLDYIKRLRMGYASTFECMQAYRTALVHKRSGRTIRKVVRDFIKIMKSLIRYWIGWGKLDTSDIDFVIDYYYLKYRALEILKNGRNYPALWLRVEENLRIARQRNG